MFQGVYVLFLGVSYPLNLAKYGSHYIILSKKFWQVLFFGSSIYRGFEGSVAEREGFELSLLAY